MRKPLLSLALLVAAVGTAQAQTGVGVGTTTPHSSAALEVSADNKGFLPPRLTQAQMAAINPAAKGLMLWCLDCTPEGFRYYDGSAWVALGASAPASATYSAASLSCSGTLSGTYRQSVTMASGNTKQISIGVAAGGAYSIATDTVNGVSFSSSGTTNTAGTNTITLTASGTPLLAGTSTYTVSVTGQPSCTFAVTYAPAATFNCMAYRQTLVGSTGGNLTNGTAYTGVYKLPYTAGSGMPYGAVTLTQSGLTLTRVADSFRTSGDSITYNLSGTYTGTTGGIVSFSLPEGCTAVFGDAIRRALASAGCASCTAYDAATTNSWVQITSNEYAALSNAINISSVGKYATTDGIMSSSPSGSWTATTVSMQPSGPMLPASSYVIALYVRSNGTVQNGGAKLKIQSSTSNVNGPYADYGSVLPVLATPLSGSAVYFAIKRPSVSTLSSSSSYVAMYGGTVAGFVGSTSGSPGSSVASGDASNLNSSGGQGISQFQVLSTTNKMW